jgi:ZIP family zinc transporter/zinc and cadmium transporter
VRVLGLAGVGTVGGAAALAGLGSLVGTVLVLWREAWVRRFSLAAVALAAGAMATTALTHLGPEAIATHADAPYWILAGFSLFFLLNQVVSFHACAGTLPHLHPIGTMALVGILAHSFFDGVAIGSAFGKSGESGRIVATAVFLHEVPEGAITVVILLHTGMARLRALAWGVFCGALTPIGALATAPFAEGVDPAVLAALLGVSAGSFLYIAATNLLPETHREAHRSNALAFVAGVGVILALTAAGGDPHVHGEGDDGHGHAGHSHGRPPATAPTAPASAAPTVEPGHEGHDHGPGEHDGHDHGPDGHEGHDHGPDGR